MGTFVADESTAKAQEGVVRGEIINGTTGEPGRAESVTLYDLASGMDPVAFLDEVSGAFTLDGLEVQTQSPYLLQATYQGVNYNETIRFGSGYEVEASVMVYELTDQWNDVEIPVARYLIRREHDQLKIDQLFVVENKTEPKKTLYDPEGAFRFHLPPGVQTHSVSASYSSRLPVPQSTSALADSSGFSTETALKPGTTDIAISYELDYSPQSYRLREKAFHPLAELSVLIAPADIAVEAEGWEDLGVEPEGRFTVFRQTNVAAGSPIEMTLSGGSEHAADLISSSQEGSESSSGMRVTRLPDPSEPQKWILVLLMGAALAYGLLSSLMSAEKKDTDAEKTERGKR